MKKLVEKKEWVYPIILAIIIPLLTLVPLFYGYATEPEGKEYMGIYTNVVDSNTYFDYMNQAAEGHIIFRNSYTSEEMKPLLIRPLYWLMGVFSAFLPAIFVFHFFRVVLSAAFIIIAYQFISHFLKDKLQRRFAITALIVGSGFGWYLLQVDKLIGIRVLTIDLGIAEAFPFLGMHASPHFILSYILFIGIMLRFYKGVTTNENKHLVVAGLLGLLMGFVHIYNMVTIYLVTGIYLLTIILKEKKLSKKRIVQGLLFYGISIPSAIYYFIVFTFDPIYNHWKEQNLLLSPPIYKLVLGLGILFFLAILFVIARSSQKKKLNEKEKYLFIWYIVTFIALYLPIAFQIRFIEGYFVPVTILGTMGLFYIFKKLNIKKKYYLALGIALLIILVPTSIHMHKSYYEQNYYAQSKYSVPYHLTEEEIDVMQWLEANTDHDDVVLANIKLSNYIPRLSGNKVYVGHWAQTIDYDDKEQLARHFYSGAMSSIVPADYIIANKGQEMPGYLEKAYENEQLIIWENQR